MCRLRELLLLITWRRVVGTTLLVALGPGFTALPCAAQQPTSPTRSQGRQITLREQLTIGLRAVTKGDFAFIDQVVILVEQGKLPRRMVDGTFLWARQRADRHSRSRSLRPMIYFKPALTLRAKRIGVKL